MNDEQIEELGALESIYPDIIQKQTENCFDVSIVPEIGPDNYNGVKLNILFTENYPNEAPIISYKPLGELPSACVDEIKVIVSETITRSMNSPMTFDIIESVKEYIHDFYTAAKPKPVEVKKKTYETYTPVSLDSFLAWKQKYDDENREIERVRMESIKSEVFINGLLYSEVWAKPTGRQLFEGGFEVEEIKEEDVESIA
jgi:RWD domain